MPRIFIIIFNGLLSLVIAAIALSVIVVPFLPELIYAETGDVEIENIVQETRKTHKEEIRENFLLIPKIRVASIINEGDSYLALDQGAWRRPLASKPKEGGNTVIVAHRFLNGMQERGRFIIYPSLWLVTRYISTGIMKNMSMRSLKLEQSNLTIRKLKITQMSRSLLYIPVRHYGHQKKDS